MSAGARRSARRRWLLMFRRRLRDSAAAAAEDFATRGASARARSPVARADRRVGAAGAEAPDGRRGPRARRAEIAREPPTPLLPRSSCFRNWPRWAAIVARSCSSAISRAASRGRGRDTVGFAGRDPRVRRRRHRARTWSTRRAAAASFSDYDRTVRHFDDCQARINDAIDRSRARAAARRAGRRAGAGAGDRRLRRRAQRRGARAARAGGQHQQRHAELRRRARGRRDLPRRVRRGWGSRRAGSTAPRSSAPGTSSPSIRGPGRRSCSIGHLDTVFEHDSPFQRFSASTTNTAHGARHHRHEGRRRHHPAGARGARVGRCAEDHERHRRHDRRRGGRRPSAGDSRARRSSRRRRAPTPRSGSRTAPAIRATRSPRAAARWTGSCA